MHKIHIDNLLHDSSNFALSNGEMLCAAFQDNYGILLEWLDYFSSIYDEDIMKSLRLGIKSAIVESIACASIGMLRPCIVSMRLVIDLTLGWLFFKDHPIEWEYVNDTGKGFMLKSDVIAYLEKVCPAYKRRYGVLVQIKSRRSEEPYKVLSAHIHGQNEMLVPTCKTLNDIIDSLERIRECSSLAKDVSEYINDIFLSTGFWSWASLPKNILQTVEKRFKTREQKSEFYRD